MGYRAVWLTGEHRASRHLETVLYAYDREVNPTVPSRLLDVGVENGGSVDVWRAVLPEGSEVVSVDIDPACEADLTLDVTDAGAVRAALRGQWFDYIVDDSGERDAAAVLWPFLRAGGVLLVERPHPDFAPALIGNLVDGDGWLPGEEVLRVTAYPGVVAVEKRHPRATGYLECVCGTEGTVMDDAALMALGVKRVMP